MKPLKQFSTITFIVMIQLIIAGAGSFYIWYFNVETEKELLRNEAANFAGHAQQTALASSFVMDQVVDAVTARPELLQAFDGAFTNTWALKISQIPQVRSVVLIRADGLVVNDAVIRDNRTVNLGDRDYFVAAQAKKGQTVISEPIYSRLRDSWVTVMARAVYLEGGQFIGLVILGIEPNYFLDYYSSVSGLNVALLSETGAISAARFLNDTSPPISQKLRNLPPRGTSDFADLTFLGNGLVASMSVGAWPWTVVVHQPVFRITQKILIPVLLLVLMTVAAIGISLFLIVGLQRRERQLADKNKELYDVQVELERLVSIDPLTETLNRKGFFDSGRQELKRCRRYKRPITIVAIDIDRFKSINDQYGHATGDEALRIFAKVCGDLIRDTDVFARIGGEEFAVVLPEAGARDAESLAKRILERISQHPIWPAGQEVGDPIYLTASIGLCEIDAEEGFEHALMRADKALYDVKNSGRNGVKVAA